MESVEDLSALKKMHFELPKFISVKKEFFLPLLIIIPIVIIQFFCISQFKQFPGPMYGGDIYLHSAEATNIYNGNAPWENFQVSGEFAYYGWLNQFIIAWIAKIFSLSVFTSYTYFPIILTFFVGFVSYFLGLEFFREKKFALILCLITLTMSYHITDPMRILGDYGLSMLFMLFLSRSIRNGNLIDRFFAGISLGLAGLCHVAAFPALASFAAICFIYYSFLSHIRFSFNSKEMKLSLAVEEKNKTLFQNIIIFIPIGIIGFLIAMLFLGPIIFFYHGSVKNPLQEYTEPDLSKYGMNIFFDNISGTFFNMGSISGFIISIAVLFGLYSALSTRNDIHSRLIILLTASAFITGFHYFITLPLFGKALIPSYFYAFQMGFGSAILFVFAIRWAYKSMQTTEFKKLILMATFLFMIANIISVALAAYDDTWADRGRQDPPSFYSEIIGWVDENTESSDIFLSHEELSFAISSMTTRKLMVSRRTHFSPYIDINQRIADAAVILYGNNSQKSGELLRKYNISYVYWDANWLYFFQNEPSLTDVKYENYLKENGVQFQKIETYLDPAWSKYYPKAFVLAIIPNINQTQPWTNQLNSRLTLEKTFYYGQEEFARIYKIEREDLK